MNLMYSLIRCYLLLIVSRQSYSTPSVSNVDIGNTITYNGTIEFRSLRIWQPKFYAIDFTDKPYLYFNNGGLLDYINDEVVLSKDGKRLAVKGSNQKGDSFYALYSTGEPFGKNEWVYYERPGGLSPRTIPGQSISFSYDTNSIAIGYSRCDSTVEYVNGLICMQVNDRKGPNYNVVTNADEHGFTWGKSVSLSEDGAFMAVGTSEGAVYVYNTFALLLMNDLASARIGNPIFVGDTGSADNTFGEIVKIAGDQSNPTVAVGGKGDRVAVYRYNSKTNTWSKLGSDIPTGGSGDKFCISHQGYIVAVAYRETSVHVYQLRTGNDGITTWVRRGQDIIKDSQSVSISISDNGSVLAVGAYGGGAPGSVTVYEFVNNQWEAITLSVEGKVASDIDVEFGRSVSLSGDGHTLAVASPARQGVGIAKRRKGYVMVFELGDAFPSSMPSDVPAPTPAPSKTSQSPSISPHPTAQPSVSIQPSSFPTSAPTSSTCLFNCDCKDGGECDMSQCTHNCNCQDGFCDMSNCMYDCRCEGGNCDMRRCGSNCQCPKRGCQMDYCVYHGGCVSIDTKQQYSNNKVSNSEGGGVHSGKTNHPVIQLTLAMVIVFTFYVIN